MTYRTNEFLFDLPQGLKDKTVNIFSATDNGPSPFSLVVSRVPLLEGQTVADYARLQVQEMQAKMPSFTLLEQSDKKVDGEPAMFLEFVWKTESGAMHQRQILFAIPGRKLVVMFTGTCPEPFPPEWEKAFEAAAASVKIDKS